MKQKQSGFDEDAEQKQNRDKILMMTESGIIRQLVQFQTASLAEDDGKNADQADIGQEIGINIFLFGFNIVAGAEPQNVADADRHQHLDIVAGKHQHQRRQKVQKHQPVQGIFGIFGTESILQQHQQSQYRQGKHQINVAGVDDNQVIVLRHAVDNQIVDHAAFVVAEHAVAHVAVEHFGNIGRDEVLNVLQRVLAMEDQLSHVRHIKKTCLSAHCHMFGKNSRRILHRH